MESNNWYRQLPDKPLFPDLLWSRPENKRQAGKLLIVGGNQHGFAAVAAAYAAATAAGIGSARVLLPDVLKKTLGNSFAEADFTVSTPSGSFARRALDSLLEHAKWADGVLLAGDFGRSSETAILLEGFAQKYSGQLNLAGDSIDYFSHSNSVLLKRDSTVITANLSMLQKLAKNNRPSTPILHSMNLHELVTVIADWTNSTPASLITRHADNFIVASSGQVSTTPSKTDKNWPINLAAYANVWWLQQPEKVLEALTSAVYSYINNGGRGET